MKRVVIDDRSGVLRIIGCCPDDDVYDIAIDDGTQMFTPVAVQERYVLLRPPLSPSGALNQTFHPEQR